MKDPLKIIGRVESARDGLVEYRRKVHRLRRLVVGDVTALEDGNSERDLTEEKKRAHDRDFPSIMVKTIEEGRANKLLQAIRTLGMQTVYRFPEIEFEDLEHEESSVNAGYLKAVLSPPPRGCDAVRHMKWCLYDYLTGGLGFNWVTVDERGRPLIRAVDTLDMTWDLAAPTIADSRWMSCTVPGTLGEWELRFGSKPFAKYAAMRKNDDPDSLVDLEFYYDIEEGGRFVVFFKDGNEELNQKPVFASENPCFFEVDGQRMPFLPFECMMFMELPGAGLPVGIAEQMLPSQIALWRADKTLRDLVDMPSWWDVPEGAYDADEAKKILDCKTGTMVSRKKESQVGAELKSAPPLPQPLVDWRNQHEKELVAQGGVNPYASGAPVEGTNYAAEVNAIQGQAGLVAGTIGKDNADFWVRTLRKVLAKGKAYDSGPVTIEIDSVKSAFGENFPIGPYLTPFAEIVIHEDSMQFIPKEQRIAMAKDRLNVASLVGQFFPNAVKEEYRNYLLATGEKNVDKYLAPPDPMQMQMAPPPV